MSAFMPDAMLPGVDVFYPTGHSCFFRRLISAAIIASTWRKESRRALASASFQATSAWSF